MTPASAAVRSKPGRRREASSPPTGSEKQRREGGASAEAAERHRPCQTLEPQEQQHGGHRPGRGIVDQTRQLVLTREQHLADVVPSGMREGDGQSGDDIPAAAVRTSRRDLTSRCTPAASSPDLDDGSSLRLRLAFSTCSGGDQAAGCGS
jgi:hypothetical protein